MGISRRLFLKLSGTALAGSAVSGLLAPAARAAQPAREAIPGVDKKAMLNDTSRCIGCLACAIACKEFNKLPDTYEYAPATDGNTYTTVRFNEGDKGATPGLIKLKVQCMHCTQASCVEVCPTGAAYKRADGIVLFNQETCIGCGYCVVACPFKAPGVSAESGTARKCTFCEPRLKEGKITACAEACPARAIEYGDYEELLKKAHERVEYLKSHGYPNAALYGRKELKGLKVVYILTETAEVTGLPAEPRPATGDALTKWLTGLLTAGLLVSVPLRSVFREDGARAGISSDKSGVSKDG